jgi:hypothetical protein
MKLYSTEVIILDKVNNPVIPTGKAGSLGANIHGNTFIQIISHERKTASRFVIRINVVIAIMQRGTSVLILGDFRDGACAHRASSGPTSASPGRMDTSEGFEGG